MLDGCQICRCVLTLSNSGKSPRGHVLRDTLRWEVRGWQTSDAKQNLCELWRIALFSEIVERLKPNTPVVNSFMSNKDGFDLNFVFGACSLPHHQGYSHEGRPLRSNHLPALLDHVPPTSAMMTSISTTDTQKCMHAHTLLIQTRQAGRGLVAASYIPLTEI